ncbi:aspartic proteinase NANA, chloroplast-like [Macadamia integrifolia]|uniref:aspartic proteinase NANA, chloroplast-like n=1 Tax=Macadamia integrifolia TaxID=60698 RepID=UPI001C4FA106|nr:aspartic proteinase NANA, chloroplast-like [Macadamia integrifolia]
MSLQSLLQFLLLLFISINGFSVNPTFAKVSSVIHFEMIHRHSPEILGEKILSRIERIKELLDGDKIRMEIISHKHKLRAELEATSSSSSSSRRRASQLRGGVHGANSNSSFSLPLLSGSYVNKASYYVPFRFGTPAQKFLLVADTGSDLTWINCRLKCNQRNRGQIGRFCITKDDDTGRRIFYPDRSRTFRTVPCSTELCRQGFFDLMSTTECPTPKSPCSYSYPYASTEVAEGIFAYDSVTVNLADGRKKKIHGMLMGCSREWDETSGLANADGILGLGFNSHTFVSSVYKDYQGKFSYCLMDGSSPKNVSNYLTFGHRNAEEMPPNMEFTELGLIGDHFCVTVEGIYVDGVKLDIPDQVWKIEMGGGMIIDSGFSLTTWVQEAYGPIMAALETPLLHRYPRIEVEGLESCFKVPKTDKKYESLVPKLEIQFMSGVRLKPAVKSYFIDGDDNGAKCIGFIPVPVEDPSDSYISILGNIMQENHMWEFDISRSRLGFASSSCVLRHHHRFPSHS